MQDNDLADFEILRLASDKRKFAIALDYPLDQRRQDALERGQEHEWFRLIDVTRVEAGRGQVLRVFRLTDAGIARLAALAREAGWN